MSLVTYVRILRLEEKPKMDLWKFGKSHARKKRDGRMALNLFPSGARRTVSSPPYYANEKQRDGIKGSNLFPTAWRLEVGFFTTMLHQRKKERWHEAISLFWQGQKGSEQISERSSEDGFFTTMLHQRKKERWHEGLELISNRIAVGGWFLHYHATPTKNREMA